MNYVILTGRLTRDPEIYYKEEEESPFVARYTLAVDRWYGQSDKMEQTADFIPCAAFGKSAEFAKKYLQKGSKIVLSGRLQSGNYFNQEGQKIYTLNVVAEKLEFAESKGKVQEDYDNK